MQVVKLIDSRNNKEKFYSFKSLYEYFGDNIATKILEHEHSIYIPEIITIE